MKFTELSEDDKEFIISRYKETDNNDELSKDSVQEELSDKYDVSKRTIRNWIKDLGLIPTKDVSDSKILVYDIETSRAVANIWWTGKRYIGHKDVIADPKIISIAWKWLGEDKIYSLTWDKNHDDKEMLITFLAQYNRADMVIGQNNDRFDNRWVNARAMKHDLYIDVFVKSFDIMKQTKRLFRLISYSMDYITKYLGVENKLEHEGIKMWNMVERGTPAEQKEYLKKMVIYNEGDIIATEAMYTKLRKYMGHKVHFGVLQGGEKYSCPNCGSTNVEHMKVMTTPKGAIQHVMRCKDDGCQYQLSNREYLKFLDK